MHYPFTIMVVTLLHSFEEAGSPNAQHSLEAMAKQHSLGPALVIPKHQGVGMQVHALPVVVLWVG